MKTYYTITYIVSKGGQELKQLACSNLQNASFSRVTPSRFMKNCHIFEIKLT